MPPPPRRGAEGPPPARRALAVVGRALGVVGRALHVAGRALDVAGLDGRWRACCGLAVAQVGCFPCGVAGAGRGVATGSEGNQEGD